MVFTTKKVKSQTLGEYLQAGRDRSGLSLSDISKFSQVQSKFILALEEGHYEVLPDIVYVKGFLKKLGKIYEVDAENLCKMFLEEREINLRLPAASSLTAEKIKRNFMPSLIFSPKTLVFLGVLLLGFLSVAYLYFQMSSLNRPPALELASPAADQMVGSSTILVKGKTEAGASVYLNDQPIMVDAEGNFLENLSLGPGANQLSIKAINKFGRDTVVSRSVFLTEKGVAGSFVAVEAVPQEIVLEIRIENEPSWIALLADGTPDYSGTMLVGSSRIVKAKHQIILTSGNAGSTRVIFNGKDLGRLGRSGEVIRNLEFAR